MDAWFWVFISYIVLNTLLLLAMIFLERRKLSSVISWLTILTFLPGVGFIIYLIFGSGLSWRVKKLIRKHKLYTVEYDESLQSAFSISQTAKKNLLQDESTIKCCYNYGSALCPNNKINFLTSGQIAIENILKDIESAKESINVEYYIFANDKVGQKVMNALIKKAKEGVKVKLIYDSIGSLKAPRRFFRKLKKAGGGVAEFFPPFMHIRLVNMKLNYRNHRKIIVIDGRIGYTGGVNIRDDHMGLKKKVSPWRDTHLRIEGTGVYALQNIFLNDWRYVKNENLDTKDYVAAGYFPKLEKKDDAFVQVLASGPDSNIQTIKEVYVKLITNAKSEICIQTPYFIPDETFMAALRIALASGVKVKIMVPYKPDYKFVYWATLSYLKDMADLGANIYFYDGFVHAKTLMIDDNKISVGTCNIDNRSFGLNFEDTVLIYDKECVEDYREIFKQDLNNCIEVDSKYFKKKKSLNKFAQAFFRLFSAIF